MAIQPLIIELRRGAELPSYVKLRARISDTLFTVDMDDDYFGQIHDDPDVRSYEINRPVISPSDKRHVITPTVDPLVNFDIMASAEELWQNGRNHHWWNVDYKTMKEFEQEDPIGHDEFVTIVANVLLKSIKK